MSLQSAIESISGWQSKTDAELLAAVQAITDVQTDSQLYTYAGIIDKLGIQNGFAFRATVRNLAQTSNPGQLPSEAFEAINFAHERFAGGGLDLSRSDVQSMLQSFVAITPLAPFIASVKSIGVSVTNPHGSATLQQVAQAASALRLDVTKQAKRWAAAQRYNAYVAALDDWDGSGSEPVL